jgi:2,4-dienoyl-CoA reductase-like NADH-dependent reductase (Old Yellow Enzyme family)
LYDTWSKSGAGIVVTGKVMVDRKALGEPRNVVVENEKDLAQLKRWIQASYYQNIRHGVKILANQVFLI